MSKKLIMLAIMPILFQSLLLCDDINKMIMPQLIEAQQAMDSNTKLDLEEMGYRLVLFGRKSEANALKAVNCLKNIKNALETHKIEEEKAWSQGEKTWWDYILNRHPEKVIKEIDPALKKVHRYLKDLNANSKALGYLTAYAVGSAVLMVAFIASHMYLAATSPESYQQYAQNLTVARQKFQVNRNNELDGKSKLRSGQFATV